MDRKYKFHDFCVKWLDPVYDTTKSQTKKGTILHNFEQYQDDNIFPVMRLLCPDYDDSRGSYGLKEKTLGDCYIAMLGLTNQSEGARQLQHFKDPAFFKKGEPVTPGVFTSVLDHVLKHRSSSDPSSFTLFDVNNFLDKLSKGLDASERKRLFGSFVRRMSTKEMSWLARIILRDMKIGISSDAVLRLYHEDACGLYQRTSNLNRVCVECHDPSVRLSTTEVKLFDGIRPMLCEKLRGRTIEDIMKRNDVLVEPKFDGWRLLLHKKSKEIKMYTRVGRECTKNFGSLIDLIRDALCNVRDCILDGEILGWNTVTGTPSPFESIREISSGSMPDAHLCIMFFDVLLVDGEALTQRSLIERKKILEVKVLPVGRRRKNVIDVVEAVKMAPNNDQVLSQLDEKSVYGVYEGIVIKNASSFYAHGRTDHWIKVKPDYLDHLGDDADLLIMGGYYTQSGRRSAKLATFLVGVLRNKPANDSVDPESVVCLACGRIAGFTDVQIDRLNRLPWKPFDAKNPPKQWDGWVPTIKGPPSVYVEPNQSCIVQVRAYSLNSAPNYSSGYTLRFPRPWPKGDSIRDDKKWFECWTLHDLSHVAGRFHHGAAGNKRVREERKKKKTVRATKSRRVLGAIDVADMSGINVTGNLFIDIEFCLFPMDESAILTRIILANGGKVVASPGRRTRYRISRSDKGPPVIGAIQNDKDVIRPSWIHRCVAMKRLVQMRPSEVIHAGDETKRALIAHYDAYGDSYTQSIDRAELERLFDVMDRTVNPSLVPVGGLPNECIYSGPKAMLDVIDQLDDDEIDEIDDALLGYFRRCVMFLSDTSLQFEVEYYGGLVSDAISSDTTHVVVKDIDELARYKDAIRQIRDVDGHDIHVVTPLWLEECVKLKRRVNDAAYRPK